MGNGARVFWLGLVAWLLLSGFKCDGRVSPAGRSAPERTERPAADLKLLVLTDPKGYLEPCGCNKRPLGGVDRLATVVAAARKQGAPTLLLAAGDLTFGSELHAADAKAAQAQERLRARTLVEVWSELGMAAVAPGPLDFSLGSATLTSLAQASRFPWLSETLRAGDKPIEGLRGAQILRRGSLRVGVMGVQAPPSPSHPLPAGVEVQGDPAEAAARAARALRGQGADLVIALVHADRRAARRIAKAGADLVILGGQDRESPAPPALYGGGALLHAGRQGQRVLEVDLGVRGEGPLVDLSAWTRQAEEARLRESVRDLEARIRRWERDPATRGGADLARQRARLSRLKAQRAAAGAPPSPPAGGRWLSARIVELSPDVPKDAQVAAKLDAHDRAVNEHNCRELRHLKPAPAPAGQPHYAGAEACKGCHEAAFSWWRGHAHGRAYATLEREHKNCNLSCVGCHVTGYNEPGGSTVTHVERLKDVGCEVCHGPGSQHLAQPKRVGAVRRDPPREVCVACHNSEHSKRFQYEAFKQLLIVPGHGLPVDKAAR